MDTTKILLHTAVLTWTGMLIMAWTGPARAANVEKEIETPVRKAVSIDKKTQAAQVQWRDEKDKKIQMLESLEKEAAALAKEREAQAERRETLTAKVAVKKQQLADIEQIKQRISPFLDQLLEQIKAVRDHDLPFLAAEREKRITALEALNKDPDVPVSEKFRKLMEALMVEAEYGQTVEVYQQTVDLTGEPTLVNIFRLGRLRLFYQTLDKQHCGFYNMADKAWQPLDRTYVKTIQAAVDMGSKRKPVEILDLPLGRMVVR